MYTTNVMLRILTIPPTYSASEPISFLHLLIIVSVLSPPTLITIITTFRGHSEVDIPPPSLSSTPHKQHPPALPTPPILYSPSTLREDLDQRDESSEEAFDLGQVAAGNIEVLAWVKSKHRSLGPKLPLPLESSVDPTLYGADTGSYGSGAQIGDASNDTDTCVEGSG
ncbi:hypothetical protein BDZ89DRAFT_1042111 [Hymenopellis radicata]|nr:hypothetical protein BDZ89DRAFT_1042111 [Hymenopellis radicata]